MEPKLFVATKAFISYQGKILILRESKKYHDGSNQGKYDVVGGRIKPGQNFKDSLLREIKEETGLDVVIGKPFFVNEWRPVVDNKPWQIVGIFFNCEAKSQQITLSQDHDDYLWVDPKDYKDYNIIENLSPVFEAYLNQ
ncbi:MAG: NUDIX domain-containing protein [Patescibacteria group bacterium]